MLNRLDLQTQENLNQWIKGNYDAETKATLQAYIDAEDAVALTDAFYKQLEFGTGGLRGIMGVGSNRINKYTIGTATQGLANFLLKQYPNESIAVAIAHDSRNQSDYFAQITADVFSANGILVYFFNELRPTPLLSYTIRQLNCKSGVMITASHNPKEYNGYKAYAADGCQLTAPNDRLVIEEVNAIKDVSQVKFQRNEALVKFIDDEMDQRYLQDILELSLAQAAIARQSDLKIVYSSIHGTGITLVPAALEKFGFKNLRIVESQANPDGNFPTVVYPNPEEKDALDKALEIAQSWDADLVMATDPDADRVGIAVKNLDNKFVLINGNQTACLLISYLLTRWKDLNKLDGNQYIVKTIVTSNLIEEIALKKEVPFYNTLTGFKYIGELMTALAGEKYFIGGGEESYGLLIGDLVRDKDAVISCAFIAEMVAYYKDQGISLYEAMIEMYQEYHLYKEDLISLTKTGKAGAEEIKAMMEKFRANTPLTLGGSRVQYLKDYAHGYQKDFFNNQTSKLDYPKSDVLQFITEDGSIISARPSGTEPKIKFYCSVKTSLTDKQLFESTEKALDEKIKHIMEDLQK